MASHLFSSTIKTLPHPSSSFPTLRSSVHGTHRNFISVRGSSSFRPRPISHERRNLCVVSCSSKSEKGRVPESSFQEIIRKYVGISGNGHNHATLASALGTLTWKKPLHSEFQQLARESEYAAWTLVNGYALNHVTISVHRLKSRLRNIKSLNQFIEENGFRLNSEGGVLKVSPDGLLLQSSTVADSFSFEFSDGITESVPCSYIEFAERLVLPEFRNLPEGEVEEFHRRDGFEVVNADKIFESTSKEQLTRRAA